MLCCTYADYVDENGDLLDEIILPQGATGNKDDPSRGSTGGARRGSKSAGADGGLGLGLDADLMNQAALAALMQQGAWQVGGCDKRDGRDALNKNAGNCASQTVQGM